MTADSDLPSAAQPVGNIEATPRAETYRVLARKYRPTRLGDLIGQDVLIRTLRNAFDSGRLAHAYLLTGVRGVGKTTTARIIARALNCVGANGELSAPTPDPCGSCSHCTAIAEDRHVDVLEMDAASRTGVDDIRELIEGVRYLPSVARFKVYIIDEVHMLSVNAFNALLKTLEEPPPHVIFVFATTEPRKIPMTVLSRCQRFDLRRVESGVLVAHFEAIAKKEAATISSQALALIARAADGSVRDGLSLLDQAISQSGTAAIDDDSIRGMLGLADRARVFELFEAVMAGRIGDALDHLNDQYRAGADPSVILQDLMAITHWLTRLNIVPRETAAPGLPELESQRGQALAAQLSVPELTRCWQILLKGLAEVNAAPTPLEAAEMVLVRLTYAADLPTPADLVRKLTDEAAGPAPQSQASSDQPPPAARAMAGGRDTLTADGPEPRPATIQAAAAGRMPATFREAVALFSEHREMMLVAHLVNDVRLVAFEPGRLEVAVAPSAPADLANKIGACLSRWTDQRWVVAISDGPSDQPLAEQDAAARDAAKQAAADTPLVRQLLDAFPGAEIAEVRSRSSKGDAK